MGQSSRDPRRDHVLGERDRPLGSEDDAARPLGGPSGVPFRLRVEPVATRVGATRHRFVATTVALCALAGLGLAFVIRVRVWPLSVGGALVGLVGALLQLASERRWLAEVAARAPRLTLAPDGTLELVGPEARTEILPGGLRYGLSLLSSPARDLVVLAVTHRDGIEYLGGRRPSGTRHESLLARTITVPESDLPLLDDERTFDDGDVLLDLCAALEEHAPGSLDRVFLSDVGMADVVVDDARLRAGQLDFDLRSPLRFRTFAFQEGTMLGAHGFQATQVRQGDREVVLVALASASELASPALLERRDGPMGLDGVRRALGRDLRLAQGLVEMPPPRGQRVAVDRLFMPRLRVALDTAPLAPLEAPPPVERVATPHEGMDRLRSSSPDVRQ